MIGPFGRSRADAWQRHDLGPPSSPGGRAAQVPPPMAVVPFISQTIVLPLTLEAHAPF